MASAATVTSTLSPSLLAMPNLRALHKASGGGGGGGSSSSRSNSNTNSISNRSASSGHVHGDGTFPAAIRPRTAPGPSPSPGPGPDSLPSAHHLDHESQTPQKPKDAQLLNSIHVLKRPPKIASQKSASSSTYSYSPLGANGAPTSTGRSRSSSSSWASAGGPRSTGSMSQGNLHVLFPSRLPVGSRVRAKPNELFGALPREVLELILLWLKRLHLDRASDSCPTCWMRDLCNVALCSRALRSHAQAALYREILLVGPDSAAHKKKFKNAQGARLVLLRRTLRANPDIARLVRVLKVPRPEPPLNWTASKGMAWLEQYEDRIASLVSACPNLERVLSPTWNYDHSWKRLYHALSTRRNLKEMLWVLDPAVASSPSSRPGSSSKRILAQETTGVLTPSQEKDFLQLHRNWPSLQTLSVYCRPGSSLAPHTLLSRTLTCLPSLRHLHLCNMSSDAFNDHNLLSLPRLQSLTLSHINGITSGGLSTFATRPNSAALRRLDLRHTPLTSLPALARILSNLPNLTSFSLVQTFQPVMPETDSFTLWMMPYLASASIVKLHWDITNSVGPNAADDILARSIEAGGFPSLTTLRTPKDPEGKFQALCRPVTQISRPSDRFGSGSGVGGFGLVSSQTWSLPTSPVSPSSPIQPIQHSLTMMSLPSLSSSHHSTPMASDLAMARVAAQARLEAAQEQTTNFRMQVNIIAAEDGRVAESFGIGNYLGTMGSRIAYHLEPDEGATDEAGGLLDVSDLAGDAGEMLGGTQQGCVGAWNTREGVVADRKEKEKWWHTERGRWREVIL